MDPMVFQFIGDTVTNATNAFVTPAATNLISALQIIAVTGVTLYIVMTGYAISTGAIESPFWTFAKQCVKIIIISFFALTVDGYTNHVIGALNGLETGLSDAMNTGGGTSQNIYQVLDQSLGKGFELVAKCFQKADEAGWSIGAALGWICAGIVMAIGTVLVSMGGGATVIVAKFALAIVFALGPLFIMALMFPATAKFFDSWFGQVMNYILTIVIMAIIMTFAMKAFDAFLAKTDLDQQNPMLAALQIGVLTGVLLYIIKQAGGIASALGGGMSLAAVGIRHMVAPLTAPGRAAVGAYNTMNPMTTARNMKTGMMETARYGQHFRAGNTRWNPAYRQYLNQNRSSNWGRAEGGSASKD